MSTAHFVIKSIDFKDTISAETSSIWGEIHVQINGFCFPDAEWYDVLSSLLDMWLFEILDFIYNKKTQCMLYFMDGPYAIQIQTSPDNQIFLLHYEHGDGTFVNTTVNSYDFLCSFLNCANLFIESCRINAPCFTTTKVYSRIINAYHKLNTILRGQTS